MVDQLIAEINFCVMVVYQDGEVINVNRVGHGHQVFACGVHGVRHVVIDPIAHIV